MIDCVQTGSYIQYATILTGSAVITYDVGIGWEYQSSYDNDVALTSMTTVRRKNLVNYMFLLRLWKLIFHETDQLLKICVYPKVFLLSSKTYWIGFVSDFGL